LIKVEATTEIEQRTSELNEFTNTYNKWIVTHSIKDKIVAKSKPKKV